MEKEEIKKLYEAALVVNQFSQDIESGCSFWIDFQGNSHCADMGYVVEFLDDLIAYLETQ